MGEEGAMLPQFPPWVARVDACVHYRRLETLLWGLCSPRFSPFPLALPWVLEMAVRTPLEPRLSQCVRD